MDESGEKRGHRGRETTTDAILAAALELFSAKGYAAVTVREIGERAGVSHALVHRYVGSKADIFRAVLERYEGALLAAAPDDSDLLESAARMLREGLLHHRDYVRLVIRSAMSGLSYDRTTGRFAATERLVELAQRSAYAASPAERAEKDLDPRLVVACVVSLFLGLAAAESWAGSRGRAPRDGRGRSHRWRRTRDPRHPEGQRCGRRIRRRVALMSARFRRRPTGSPAIERSARILPLPVSRAAPHPLRHPHPVLDPVPRLLGFKGQRETERQDYRRVTLLSAQSASPVVVCGPAVGDGSQ